MLWDLPRLSWKKSGRESMRQVLRPRRGRPIRRRRLECEALEDRAVPTSVQFQATSYTAMEQPRTTTYAPIGVVLDAPSSQQVTVQVSTGQGSAVPGQDYTPITSQTVTFAPGQTQQVVYVQVLGDPQADGTETVPLTLSNPTNASLGANTGTLLNLQDSSQAPVAQNQNYSVAHDGALSIAAPGLVAGASDPSGQPLSVATINGSPVTFDSPITLPSGGTLTVESDSSLYYAPPPGFVGNDSFTFTLSDGTNTSNTATTSIAVTEVAPVANPVGPFTTLPGTPLPINVLASAYAPEGGTLTPVITQAPKNGSLTVGQDGLLTYQPNAGFTGQDGFTYDVTDGITSSNPVTVQLTVAAQPLVANPVYMALGQGGTAVFTDQDLLAYDQNLSGSSPSVTNFTQPPNGTLTRDQYGNWSYTPKAGFSGTDQATYTITNGVQTATATLAFQVVPPSPFGLPAPSAPYAGTFLSSPSNPSEIASVSSTNAMHVWTPAGSAILGSPFFVSGATRVFPAAAFNPNGANNPNINQLAVAFRTATGGIRVGILDLNSRGLLGTQVTLPGNPQSVLSVSYSPDGTKLLVTTNNAVIGYAVNADGSLGANLYNVGLPGLVSASYVSATQLQIVQTNQVTVSTVSGDNGLNTDASLTVPAPNGTIIAASGSVLNHGTLVFATRVGNNNNNFPVFMATRGGNPGNPIMTRVVPITALAVAGDTLELGFQNGPVIFYNIGGPGAPVTYTQPDTFGHHAYGTGETAVTAVALNGDGTVGYSSSLDGSVLVWSLNTQRNTLSRHTALLR